MSASHFFVSPAELQQQLAVSPSLALLDVRTPAEFSAGHIPQARSAPLNQLKPKVLLEAEIIFRNQPVCLVCRTDARAILAADEFAAAGHTRIAVVQGGTLAWIAAGLPVTRAPGQAASLERQVRIAAGSLVFIGVVLGWFVHRGFFGLSAFVGAGLVFAGITDSCGLGLSLLRLPWNQRFSSITHFATGDKRNN